MEYSGKSECYRKALHSIQKPQGKPWRRIDTYAPPKVYCIDSYGFRGLVQRLTGMPHVNSRLAKDRVLAPQPNNVESVTVQIRNEQTTANENISSLCLPQSSFNSSWCS